MVRYETSIHTTAKRELNDLDADERDRLTDAIVEVAEHRKPTEHSSVRPMTGQDGLFRLREGDLRAVCKLLKPEIVVLKVGKRKDVYENIDEVESNRLSNVRSEV